MTRICKPRSFGLPNLVALLVAPMAVLLVGACGEANPPGGPSDGSGGSSSSSGGGNGSGTGGRSGSGGSNSNGTGGSSSGTGGSSSARGGAGGGSSSAGGSSGSGGSMSGTGGSAGTGGTTPAMPDDTSYLKKPVPIIWLTVDDGKQLNRVDTLPGTVKVVTEHDGKAMLANLDGKPIALEAKAGLRIRGFSSAWFFAQKPYSLELRDDAGKDIDLPLLGMPAESDWVLSSCYSDKSCLRNALAYSIAREMHMLGGVWAPRTRFAEVYLDGRYRGLYLVVEKPKGSKNRMNLKRPAINAGAGDLTGAYMLSTDGDMSTYKDNPMDPTREFYDDLARTRWEHRFPDKDDITPEQRAYIVKATKDWEQGLINGDDWRKSLEPKSWMDYFVLTELSNNTDAFFRSWYIHKQSMANGGKWGAGPVWDYDIAFGNINYNKRYCVNNSMLRTAAPPFAKILENKDFANELRCHWQTLRKDGGPLDIKKVEAKIDEFVAHMKEAKKRDAARWSNIGILIWPNNYVGATWEDEVAYLKYWIRKRIAWMDGGGLKGTCTNVPAPPAVASVPQPPHSPNDMRLAQKLSSPPQYIEGMTPPAFVPLEGGDPTYACPVGQ
ncbi:MAG TPA: CotH kinase family protein [Polyangia bacterium]